MSSVAWPTTPGHTNPAAFQQLVSSVSQSSRAHKRKLEPDEDAERFTGQRDESMDRSPTPERPKRGAPKRARVAPTNPSSKDDQDAKENKAPNNYDDVDVGVLLGEDFSQSWDIQPHNYISPLSASLPSQSLLPLLNALLKAQPALKSMILPLIPRPTLETAIQALAQSAKKLRDAYPYSNALPPSHATTSTNFGFGRHSISPATYQHPHSTNSGMRDSYILSRLRPHISEFVSACFSYLPYFSYVSISSISTTQPSLNSQSQSHSSSLQALHKDKSHPAETFIFLSALTNHIAAQPALTQTSLVPTLFPRLLEEWNAWVERVDDIVNRQGGMFGRETVASWERELDGYADAKGFEGAGMMRSVRDKWVQGVGWLVGRIGQQPMDV